MIDGTFRMVLQIERLHGWLRTKETLTLSLVARCGSAHLRDAASTLMARDQRVLYFHRAKVSQGGYGTERSSPRLVLGDGEVW
jgi:hypothetical protein